MKQDKLYNKLLELYRLIFNSIGVDFDSIDKVDGWFQKYSIDESAEEKIVNDFINSSRLSKVEKDALKFNYYLGSSPRSSKNNDKK